MVLPAHYFRGHVARSSTCVSIIVGLDHPSYAQVSGSEVSLVVKHQILWFDVPMDDVVEVKVLKSHQNAGNEEFCLHLLEPSPAAHVIPQITTHEQIHNEVEIFPILEGVGHIDNKRVFESGEELSLVEDGVDAFLAYDLGFVHFLHGVYFLGFFELDAPDFSEAPLAHYELAVEVVTGDLFALKDESFLVVVFVKF